MRFRRAKDTLSGEDLDAPLDADPGDTQDLKDGETPGPPADDAGGLALKFSLRVDGQERPSDDER